MSRQNDGPEWFYAKRYGFGAGLPCAWQGWAILLGYMAITLGGALLFAEEHPLAYIAMIIPLTALLVLIAVKTTKGGAWKWRWGKDKGTW